METFRNVSAGFDGRSNLSTSLPRILLATEKSCRMQIALQCLQFVGFRLMPVISNGIKSTFANFTRKKHIHAEADSFSESGFQDHKTHQRLHPGAIALHIPQYLITSHTVPFLMLVSYTVDQ